jgi:iron(III) transport system ATP-binding protein
VVFGRICRPSSIWTVVANQQSAHESAQLSKRTDELLGLFDLQQRRKAFPAELSQGERSRLALARALASGPKVLLLDEPLSHVDPVRKPGYWKIVQRIVTEENISMVFTSHEPETVLRQAEHVICLDAGAVAFEGSTRTLYDHPPNRQIGEFLGPLNWFDDGESRMFLDRNASGGIRPEKLKLCIADSSLEFISMPFVGGYCESVVRHVASETLKSVFHQVPDVMPSIGDRVMLQHLGATS